MTSFQITATLTFTQTFHIGTGLSGSGVDRMIRRNDSSIQGAGDDSVEPEEPTGPASRIGYRNIPEISGDALKGAIRGSAERIVRWLVSADIAARRLDEEPDNSRPKHPALRRIFAWQSLIVPGVFTVPAYRFSMPKYSVGPGSDGGVMFDFASTAVGPDGIAKPRTLRVIEQWSAGAAFTFVVEGRGGEWYNPDSRDYLDLVLLVSAIQATSHIGGKKGNGFGETRFDGLTVSPFAQTVVDSRSLTRLRNSLVSELQNA